MNDLNGFVQLIGENSKDLALFSGTVFEGRQKFADMGESMEQYQEGLFNMGLSVDQVNSGMMGYLKLQSRVGLSQNKTTTELADGAKKYLIEMDSLSKVTGESRKAMEDQMEAARSEERFAAKLQELRSQGRVEEAKQLELANIMISKENKALAQGFRDASTGMITTEAAQKAMLVTQGQVMVQADRMSTGLATAGEGATIIGQAAGNTAKSMTGLAKAGAYFGADFAADLRSGLTDYNKALIEATKEQAKQGATGGKAADDAVQAQTDLRRAQIAGNKATEEFVFAGIVPATKAMEVLAKTTTSGVDSLNKLFGIKPGDAKESEAAKAAEKAAKESSNAARAAEKTAQDVLKNNQSTKEERKAAAQKAFDTRKAEQQAVNPGSVILNKNPAVPAGSPLSAAVPTAPAKAAPASAAPVSAAPVSVSPAAPAVSRAAAPAAGAAAPVALGAAKQKTAGGIDGGAEKTGSNDMQAPKKTASKGGGGRMSEDDIKKMIIDHEGKRYEPYKDSLGLWTVGVGHLIGDGKTLPPEWNRKFSEEEVMAMFEKDYAKHKKQAESNVPGFSKFDSMGQAALVDLTFNMGPGWPKKFKNTSAKLGAGDTEGAAEGLTNSAWYGQVGRRAPKIVGMVRNSEVTAADGGMFSGPKSGYSATLHGDEAVIPLKNGTVPVSLSMTDVLGGLGDDIAEQLKEIKNQSTSENDSAMRQVTSEFKTAMTQLSQQLSENARMQNQDGMSGVAALLQELISATKSGVDVQQKILASSY
jgi:GH24 family phage-related lysozyme (muramidase)